MKRILALLMAMIAISACNAEVERNYKDYHPDVGEDIRTSKMSSIITKSDQPVVLYSNKRAKGNDGSTAATGMAGSYLWRAALETISFMPLVSSDSNGGAIATDWYADPASPNEQFKFNIIITSTEVQIGSVKVTAFKQVRSGGHWQNVAVSKDLARNVEDNIIKKAISIRVKEEGPDKKKKK
jgi:hypothetical protein